MARMRRAASRARSAGSAATISSRSPKSTVTRPSSTPWSSSGTSTMTPAGSAPGPARSANTSRSSSRCWRRCPDEPFETGRWFTPRVDRYGQVTVRTNRYSVPVRLIGRQVRVLLHASHLVVYDGRTEVARHERLIAKGGSRLELDHYLEALVRKPGALPGATALEQARVRGQVHPGPRRLVGRGLQGPRRRRRHPGPDRGAAAAPAHAPRPRRRRPGRRPAGRCADRRTRSRSRPASAADNERAAEPGGNPAAGGRQHDVTSLTQRRLAQLPPDNRPLPSVPTTTNCSAAAAPPKGHRRHERRTSPPGLTEQAADAAIDQACRMLRLPTIRAQFPDIADRRRTRADVLPRLPRRTAAGRVRRPGPPPLRTPDQGRRVPAGQVAAQPSTSTPTPTSTPPSSTPSPPATGSRRASRSA